MTHISQSFRSSSHNRPVKTVILPKVQRAVCFQVGNSTKIFQEQIFQMTSKDYVC